MKKDLSLSQRIHNLNGCQEAENLKAVHCYTHGRGWSYEEWAFIWSRSKHCSWAHGFGRMRGFDQVWYGSVTEWNKMICQKYLRTYKVYPEISAYDMRALLDCPIHCLASGVVEAAEDGMSVRTAYMTPGVIYNMLNEDQRKYCLFRYERYGADFVYEEGRWKYLHEQVCPDIKCEVDSGNWGTDAYREYLNVKSGSAKTEGIDDEADNNPPPCADPGPLHFEYSPVQPIQNTVPYPVPYRTLDNDNTYTPFVE